MNEIPQSAPIENASIIPEGLSAVAFPKLGVPDKFGSLQPATEEETVKQLNAFLEMLNREGADIVSILDIPVDVSAGRRGPGIASENKKIAIVRKAGK